MAIESTQELEHLVDGFIVISVVEKPIELWGAWQGLRGTGRGAVICSKIMGFTGWWAKSEPKAVQSLDLQSRFQARSGKLERL